MGQIEADIVKSFRDGRRRIATVTKAGTFPVTQKDRSTSEQPFNVDDVILVDEWGAVIAGPVNFAGAEEIAIAVLEGHARTITDAATLNTLALVVAALAIEIEAP